MLARDYCDAAGRKKGKPIILSHHMLYGLKAGQAKMSKSDPDSAIFMEDSTADVRRKIRGAYCPRTADAAVARDAEMQLAADDLKNPCLDYVRHVVFAAPGATFAAGGATFASADAVRDAFVGGALSEADLKDGLADAVDARRLHETRSYDKGHGRDRVSTGGGIDGRDVISRSPIACCSRQYRRIVSSVFWQHMHAGSCVAPGGLSEYRWERSSSSSGRRAPASLPRRAPRDAARWEAACSS